MVDTTERLFESGKGRDVTPAQIYDKYRVLFDLVDLIQIHLGGIGNAAAGQESDKSPVLMALLTLLSHTTRTYYGSSVLAMYGAASETMGLNRKLIENWISAFYIKIDPSPHAMLYNAGVDISRIIWSQKAIDENDHARLPDGVEIEKVQSDLSQSTRNLAVALKAVGVEIPSDPKELSKRFSRTWTGLDFRTMLDRVCKHFPDDERTNTLKMFHQYGFKRASEYLHSTGLAHESVVTNDFPRVYFHPGPADELIEETILQTSAATVGIAGIVIEHLGDKSRQLVLQKQQELERSIVSRSRSFKNSQDTAKSNDKPQ